MRAAYLLRECWLKELMTGKEGENEELSVHRCERGVELANSNF